MRFFVNNSQYLTAAQLSDMKQKLIDDKVEALAVVKMARVRFGFSNTFLEFAEQSVATESFDFLSSLGFKVKYYEEGGGRIMKPTRALEVSW